MFSFAHKLLYIPKHASKFLCTIYHTLGRFLVTDRSCLWNSQISREISLSGWLYYDTEMGFLFFGTPNYFTIVEYEIPQKLIDHIL